MLPLEMGGERAGEPGDRYFSNSLVELYESLNQALGGKIFNKKIKIKFKNMVSFFLKCPFT